MQTYNEFRPTGYDPRGLGLEDRQDWFVAPCAINRDSSTLAKSNWEMQKEALEEAQDDDQEESDFEIHRFGHWANGWFEIMLVRPDTKAEKIAYEMESSLCDYPILSESDYSEREYEAVQAYWAGMSLKNRIENINRCNQQRFSEQVSIFAARRDSCEGDLFTYMTAMLEG